MVVKLNTAAAATASAINGNATTLYTSSLRDTEKKSQHAVTFSWPPSDEDTPQQHSPCAGELNKRSLIRVHTHTRRKKDGIFCFTCIAGRFCHVDVWSDCDRYWQPRYHHPLQRQHLSALPELGTAWFPLLFCFFFWLIRSEPEFSSTQQDSSCNNLFFPFLL